MSKTTKAAVDVAKMDEIKQLGFEAKERNGLWFAVADSGMSIGPAATIAALVTLLKTELGNKFELPKDDAFKSDDFKEIIEQDNESQDAEEIELEEDSTGQKFIPGTGPRVNKELNRAALEHYEIKTTRMEWTEKEKAAKDVLDAVAHKHEALFAVDAKTGKKTYLAGDIEVEWIKKDEDNFKTRKVGGEEE